MAKKRYKVLVTFGLPGQGFFVEGSEVEVEVAAEKPVGKLPFMTPEREQDLLADGRIELVSKAASAAKEEVKDGKVQS